MNREHQQDGWLALHRATDGSRPDAARPRLSANVSLTLSVGDSMDLMSVSRKNELHL